MRLAVLGDVHGNLPALEAVLEDIAGQAVDEILVLGDSVLKLGDSAATLRLLAETPHRAIYGNMEWAMLAGWTPAWPNPWGQPLDPTISFGAAEILHLRQTIGVDPFRRLPASITLETPAGRVLACHGTPRSVFGELHPAVQANDPGSRWVQDDERFSAALGDVAGASVVFCGHTHVAFERRRRETLVVNPGAVGWSRGGAAGAPEARYVVASLVAGREPAIEHRSARYDRDRAIRDIRVKQELVESALVAQADIDLSRAWHDRHVRLIGG